MKCPAYALSIFLAIVLGAATGTFRPGLREARFGIRGSLGFTLAGTLTAVMVAIATVYMGNQVIPLLAMLIGWSAKLLFYSKIFFSCI